jgi:hypothetical protein
MLFGSPAFFQPRELHLNILGEESGYGNASVKQSFLIGLRGRETHRLQNQFHAWCGLGANSPSASGMGPSEHLYFSQILGRWCRNAALFLLIHHHAR